MWFRVPELLEAVAFWGGYLYVLALLSVGSTAGCCWRQGTGNDPQAQDIAAALHTSSQVAGSQHKSVAVIILTKCSYLMKRGI